MRHFIHDFWGSTFALKAEKKDFKNPSYPQISILASFKPHVSAPVGATLRKLCTDAEQSTYYLSYEFHRFTFALPRISDFFRSPDEHTLYSILNSLSR